MTAVGDQLLDQLGARGLVLDQHFLRTEQPLLVAHRALERYRHAGQAATVRQERPT